MDSEHSQRRAIAMWARIAAGIFSVLTCLLWLLVIRDIWVNGMPQVDLVTALLFIATLYVTVVFGYVALFGRAPAFVSGRGAGDDAA